MFDSISDFVKKLGISNFFLVYELAGIPEITVGKNRLEFKKQLNKLKLL